MSEKTKDELQQENAKLRKQLEATTEKLQVAEATKGKNAKPVVKIGSKHYEVVSGVATASGRITRDELAKDEKKCAELINKGSELLREVKTK